MTHEEPGLAPLGLGLWDVPPTWVQWWVEVAAEPDPEWAFAVADEDGAEVDEDGAEVDEDDGVAFDVAASAMPTPPAPRAPATTAVTASLRARLRRLEGLADGMRAPCFLLGRHSAGSMASFTNQPHDRLTDCS